VYHRPKAAADLDDAWILSEQTDQFRLGEVGMLARHPLWGEAGAHHHPSSHRPGCVCL